MQPTLMSLRERIKDMNNNGLALHEIAQRLNADGIRTPRQGKEFRINTVGYYMNLDKKRRQARVAKVRQRSKQAVAPVEVALTSNTREDAIVIARLVLNSGLKRREEMALHVLKTYV